MFKITGDKQRLILRRYLLGALPEAERSELADRYFVDDQFFDRLIDVENELLDEYVSGQLSPDERRAFGDYLIRLPEGASKLATAFVLSESGREEQNVAPVSSGAVVPILPSKWAMLREWFFGGGPVLRYASVAIGVALIVSLAYLVVTQRQLRRDREQLRAERIQTEREKAILSRDTQAAQQEQAAERERIRQLEQELAQARQQQEQKEAQVTAHSPGTGTVLASLVLTPALRSGGAPDVLTLTPATKTVSLVMPVASEEQIASYRTVLQTTEGQLVFTEERLRSQPSHRGRTVKLRVAADRLTNDSYKLTLQGRAADGIEIAQDYYFDVVRN